MARKFDDVMAALPKERQQRVEARAMELTTQKNLRHDEKTMPYALFLPDEPPKKRG